MMLIGGHGQAGRTRAFGGRTPTRASGGAGHLTSLTSAWKAAPSEYSCPDPIRQALSRTRTGLEQCCGYVGSGRRNPGRISGPLQQLMAPCRAARKDTRLRHGMPHRPTKAAEASSRPSWGFRTGGIWCLTIHSPTRTQTIATPSMVKWADAPPAVIPQAPANALKMEPSRPIASVAAVPVARTLVGYTL